MPDEATRLAEHVFGAILNETSRQTALWGRQDAIPDERWLEIATDEFCDLRWAVRTRAEVPNHTIEKERDQLIAVLLRWKAARHPLPPPSDSEPV